MTVTELERQPAPAPRRSIVGYLPCDGTWWHLHRLHTAEERRTVRTKVLAWAQVEEQDITGSFGYLEAVVAGDNGLGGLASDVYPPFSDEPWNMGALWHDGETLCVCSTTPQSPLEYDDIWWCSTCAGVIDPDRR